MSDDLKEWVPVDLVRHMIPPHLWNDLKGLYTLEVGDCDQCGGQGKYQRSNTRCVSCGGTGKQIVAGGVG